MLEQKKLLGVHCQFFTIESLNDLVIEKVKADERTIIANHNLHSVYLFHKYKNFRDFFKLADYVHIDGMPLLYWAKLLGYNGERKNRITYVDWIFPLLEISDKYKLKIFYLGGKPGIAEKAISKIQPKFSHISFKERNGYFNMSDLKENNAVLDEINHFAPDILMVGMSMPRQEIWIKDNIHQLPSCVILTCGACFDYLSGTVKTPPRFFGRIGLEWLYRFIQEPRRLFSRYFIEPLYLCPIFFQDISNLITNKRK